MPISKPLQVMSLRLSQDERERLEQLAADQDLTLSQVMRQALGLYAEDAARATRRAASRRAVARV